MRALDRTGLVFALVALLAAGCSGPADATPPPGPSCTPFDYSKYTASSTQRSFAKDIVPIVGRSCTFSVCHGSPDDTQASLYLGPNVNNTQDNPDAVAPYYPPDADTITKIVGSIVDVVAVETPAMKIVAKGDPEHSYLMHKLDGDQSCVGLNDTCVDGNTGAPDKTCGLRMPWDQPQIAADERGIIRDWIAQGANDN